MHQSEELIHLVFIPGPGLGHIVSAVEFAKLIINRDTRVSITFLLFNDPTIHVYKQSLRANPDPRLHFLDLPKPQQDNNSDDSGSDQTKTHVVRAVEFISSHRSLVREAVLSFGEAGSKVKGFIVDMFCMCMTDVANEFDIPSYTFFTSSAAYLSFKLHSPALFGAHSLDVARNIKGSDEKYQVPGFVNHVPENVFPEIMFEKKFGWKIYLDTARRIRETKGVLVNTFQELEPVPVDSLLDTNTGGGYMPPIYPIGPILNLNQETSTNGEEKDVIVSWLDDQPANSVLFLCFGSMGKFNEEQIKHIAVALERSSHRFLWSLRSHSSTHDVLPLGFLERTTGVGKVIGWAPQLAVLAHPAVGGFVTHCGWNSILESLWFGVPMAAWPMYAEQQMDAFEMVVELGLATEIKMEYREELGEENVVTTEEIEKGINELMMDNGVILDKVKDMKEMSRQALLEGGSSYKFLGCFISDIIKNSPKD